MDKSQAQDLDWPRDGSCRGVPERLTDVGMHLLVETPATWSRPHLIALGTFLPRF